MTFPTQEHIDAAKEAADRVYVATGFYAWPSAALAQADIESAGWTRLTGVNNGFGIKATSAQQAAGNFTMCPTHEFVNGRSVAVSAPFVNFASLADAYEQHAMLFVRVKLYAAGAAAKTPRQFVVEIAKHYATAPNYAQVVIGIMDKLDLYQYDDPVHGAATQTTPIQPPAHSTGKTTGSVAGGVVVAGAGAAAAAAHLGWTPLVMAAVVAVIAGVLAFAFHRQAAAKVAGIPPVPPGPTQFKDLGNYTGIHN